MNKLSRVFGEIVILWGLAAIVGSFAIYNGADRMIVKTLAIVVGGFGSAVILLVESGKEYQ